MKILLITTLYPGYKEQSREEVSYAIHYFAQEWVNSGHEVRIVRPWTVYPKIASFSKKASRSQKYGFDDSFNIDTISALRIAIKKIPKIDYNNKCIKEKSNNIKNKIKNEFKPDIILCHMINPSLYIALSLKEELGIPLFLTFHTGDIVLLKKQSSNKKFNKIVRFVDGIGFRSKKIQHNFNLLMPNTISDLKQSIIYSGIDKNYIIDRFHLETKIQNTISSIFVAANFIPLKNIDTVIEAFSRARKTDTILEIAGDGPEKDNLINLAKNLDVDDNIRFLGHLNREDVLKKMRKSDLFIMVSSPETFGLVYLEAMASGCIVIGSRGEGIDGVIKEGENGFLCEPRNVSELEKIISKTLNLSTVDKKRIISNAVLTAENMTQEKMSDRYIDILEEIIAKRNKGGD